MGDQNKQKFPLGVLSISFIIAVFTFISGFVLGQRSISLSTSSNAQVMKFQSVSPPSGLQLPVNPPNILNSITGNITNIIPGLDGNIVIEVTGINIRDVMIPIAAGKEIKSQPQKYAFLVTPKTQIVTIIPPVPNIPIGDFMNKNLPSSIPSMNLTIKDLKNGMAVTVYTGVNQKITERVEVISLSVTSVSLTPTVASCTPLPESCKTDYPNCIANMGVPPGDWCPMNSINPSPSSYVACGCGCCGGTTPNKICLYRGRGDNLDTIIQQDKKLKDNPQCATAGCSIGTEYTYCD